MQNLHYMFVQLGRDRNKLTYKLLQLLPEIYASGIYKKYCPTIEEYAGRFAGLPKSLVKKRLNIEKHLQNKPKLKEAIATQGLYKVALVAKIATAENDEFLADKVANMSKSALQVLSKEMRNEQSEEQDSLFEDVANYEESESLNVACKTTSVTFEDSLKLDLRGEVLFKFLRLKKKLGKQLSNKRFIQDMIEKSYKEEFGQEDAKVEAEVQNFDDMQSASVFSHNASSEQKPENQMASSNQKESEILARGKVASEEKKLHATTSEGSGDVPPRKVSIEKTAIHRYIPIKLRRQALARTRNKCDYPNCNKPHDLFHHPDRYSKSKNHDYIAPVCKEHHEFSHNGLIENETQPSKNWQLKTAAKPQMQADILYRKFRQTALS